MSVWVRIPLHLRLSRFSRFPAFKFLAFSPRTIHNGTTTTLARHHVLDRVLPNSTQTDSPREWLGAAGNWTPQIHHGVAALHAYLRP